MQTSRHLLLTGKVGKVEKFPNVTRLRYSDWSEILPAINNLKKYNIYDKELHCYDFLTYHVEPEQVNFKSENCFKLQLCTKKEFKDLILVNTGTSSLFPYTVNILVIDWQPYEAIPSNIEYIVQDQDRCFVDTSTDCQGKLLTSCSFGRYLKVVCGMAWNSTIYAKDSEAMSVSRDPSVDECL